MNKIKAKREACSIVALLIQNYLDVGQPHEEMAAKGLPDNHPDTLRLEAAIMELRGEMERRSERMERR